MVGNSEVKLKKKNQCNRRIGTEGMRDNTPYSMEQSPSSEANQFAASQEIHRIFTKTEGSLPYSQMPATCP
jgi:hypothetical protein